LYRRVKVLDIGKATHKAGLVHGDVNRYNFIVDSKTAAVKVIDFEDFCDFDDEMAEDELESLTDELQDDSGRRGPTTIDSWIRPFTALHVDYMHEDYIYDEANRFTDDELPHKS
jgi:serine/threonine-protein kinase RIO1